MAKLLVITGITGAQGSSVYNVFKNEPGWRIRGITRDPLKHAKLQAEGVELVKADFNDQASLERAFSGANAIFAMTDFFQHLFADPSTFERAQQEGKKPGEIAEELDIQQGSNLVRAAAKQTETLERLVYSTLSDARKWSNGKVTENYHFNGTAASVQYLKDEFPELAKRTSYLQLGNFLSNWKYLKSVMFKPQSDGSMLIQYILRPHGKPQPFLDAPHDTGHFVRALILSDKAPPGTTMTGFRGELMTVEEYFALWGKVNNRKVTYRQFAFEDAVASGLPDWLVEELLVAGNYTSDYGCSGGDPKVKTPRECGVDVSKLPSVEDWLRAEDWSEVL